LQAATVNVTDAQFAGGAKGDLRACADMQMTSGNTTLTSPAQCQFTSGDVNKWVQVPLAGDANGTGLSAQISGFKDAQHVTLSVAAGATVSAATVSYSDLKLATSTTLSSVAHTFTPDQLGLVLTVTGGSRFTAGSYTITAVAYTGIATLNAIAGTPGSTNGTGTLALAGTIGTGNYSAINAVATYACAHANTTVNFPAGSYYIEKYKIQGGGSANGVTDIFWTGCTNTTVTGYGAMVSVNGSYRQLNDNSGYSFEQTVSPFAIFSSTGFVLKGLEINGNIENTTMDPVIAEGRSHGVPTVSSTVTLLDLNVHGWPADGIILGLNSLDTNDVMTNVFSHNNGRQGLTVANVNGLVATNYQCAFIGIGFNGQYLGHNPEDCTDIEPAIDPKASNISFSGGYQASAVGALFDITNTIDTTIRGVTFDCSMSGITSQAVCGNGGLGQITANTTVFDGNTVLGAFSCGFNGHSSTWLRSDFTNNTITVAQIPAVVCHDSRDTLGIPVHFNNNTVTVTGTQGALNGTMQFWYIAEASNNTFFISKNAKFFSTYKVVDYKGATTVRNNTYSTDLTNAADPYATDYTGVGIFCNELSLQPTFFVVAANPSICPTSSLFNGHVGRGTSVN